MLNNDNDEARKLVETCVLKSKHVLNPIVDWVDKDVWDFIKRNNIKYCSLYDEGFSRLGCIGCPLGSDQQREMDRWPKFKDAYLRSFERMLRERERESRQRIKALEKRR